MQVGTTTGADLTGQHICVCQWMVRRWSLSQSLNGDDAEMLMAHKLHYHSPPSFSKITKNLDPSLSISQAFASGSTSSRCSSAMSVTSRVRWQTLARHASSKGLIGLRNSLPRSACLSPSFQSSVVFAFTNGLSQTTSQVGYRAMCARGLATGMPNTDKTTEADGLKKSVEDEVGIIGSMPNLVDIAGQSLIAFHETLSVVPFMTWTSSLALAAIAVRSASLPLVYYHQMHHARAALAGKELATVQAWVRRSPGTLWQKYISFRRLRRVALRSSGTSSFSLAPWYMIVHLPLVFSLSIAVRRMAMEQRQDWMSGGILWFPDLTVADPTGALPVLNTMLWLWNVDSRTSPLRRSESKVPENYNTEGENQKKKNAAINRAMNPNRGEWLNVGLQALALFSFPYIKDLPAGMFVLWVSNGLLTACQRAFLSSPRMRKAIGLLNKEDIESLSGPPVLKAAQESIRAVKSQLHYIQNDVMKQFAKRSVNEKLCADVNRALKRELWARRISIELVAEIRKDSDSGKKYIAVVRPGSQVT